MADAKTYDWQVPEQRIIFEGERKCGSCLVIPVINEGERILSLLGRIQKSDAAGKIDVIIVDGGSTDGSLEPERLKSLGVNTLLQKTGPGKLSAQLLCGYAWALLKGYQGILTIDGNDKDDPAPISMMLQKLSEGFDFVQASRFIKGGVGENTPASRSLAIRLIHAPLLSLASGFHWTDTTQGFRAYSSRLLSDSRVAIFRDCFKEYELLAYLSYIAPKLGFRCVEVPGMRRYPKGQVPTKISSFKGNLNLMKVLLKTCFGCYNRRDS